MKKNKRLRDMSWEDYGISKNRYQELKAFCLQYEEKKNKIKYGVGTAHYDGMPRAGGLGSTVERQALENHRYQQDCLMIEKAAEKANPVIWKYLLKNVTLGITYEYLEFDCELGRIAMGKTDFYGYRKLFFYYLDRMRIGDKLSEVS